MSFKNYLTGTVFGILFIWGPIDHSWPGWLLIRCGYLVVIPLAVWFLVGWVWSRWQLTTNMEIKLSRALSTIISVGLITLATLEATTKTHLGNTQTIRTREGYEDVGDYIELTGPDYGKVFVIVIVALLFLWFGVLKNKPKSSDS